MNEQTEGSAVETSTAAATAAKKKTVYTAIKMTDGREVQFPGDTKAVTALLRADGSEAEEQSEVVGIRFDFRNGETMTATAADAEKWGLTTRFVVHGLSQKIRDNYASVKEVDDAWEATNQLLMQLTKGTWSERATGEAGAGVLLRALVEVTGQTPEDVRNTLSTMSASEKIFLRNSDELRPIITRLEAQRAGAVDKSAVLAKFNLKAA
jgi:hypothetical protein